MKGVWETLKDLTIVKRCKHWVLKLQIFENIEEKVINGKERKKERKKEKSQTEDEEVEEGGKRKKIGKETRVEEGAVTRERVKNNIRRDRIRGLLLLRLRARKPDLRSEIVQHTHISLHLSRAQRIETKKDCPLRARFSSFVQLKTHGFNTENRKRSRWNRISALSSRFRFRILLSFSRQN